MREQQRILSVSQVNAYVKRILSQDLILSRVQITGEISNFRKHSSGHLYFVLKDTGAAINAVMFASDSIALRFLPRDGIRVIVSGSVSLYEKTGQYQLYVHAMAPDGVGALYQAFEELKNKLQTEGLFDEERKRPLPAFPRKVGLVTSPTGAAVQDMIRVSKRRDPGIQLVLIPVLVQGEAAAASIVQGIRAAQNCGADVLIVGRGGGSIEDLWPFNEEIVARAIAASGIPVISAVGHEPDVTIADFVADRRASTPSNAAEIAVPDMTELLRYLQGAEGSLTNSMLNLLDRQDKRLSELENKRVLTDPMAFLQDRRLQLDFVHQKLAMTAKERVDTEMRRFTRLTASLDALSPLKVLGRGYSLAQRENGGILLDSSQVLPGERIRLQLAHGSLGCKVETVE